MSSRQGVQPGGARPGDLRLGPLPPLALVLCVVVLSAATARLFRERFDARLAAVGTLAATDALTGLANLRRFDERLEYETARHTREARSFAVLALDLDGFKQVNDRLGHAAGDTVLLRVAQAMQVAVRDQDTVARVGGDEFVVLGPETDRAEAREIQTRLVAAVRRANPDLGGGVGVGVGVAIFPDDAGSAERLALAADAALLAAKRRSRRPRLTAVESAAAAVRP